MGPKAAVEVVLAGLQRLEYRGYDSAGVAIVADVAAPESGESDPSLTGAATLAMMKRAGKLAVLQDDLARHPLPPGHTGIGHTRWATHGGPTDANAHPHRGDGGRLALIHNGIIENFAELKASLTAVGEVFTSDTDTEAAAILLGREFRATGDLREALRRTVARLAGAFTLLAVHQDVPGLVVGARRNSPLVVGLGDGEYFLGSDVAAFVAHTQRALAVGEDQLVAITASSVELTDFEGAPVAGEPFEVAWDAAAADKGGWTSFMRKEIAEQPEAVAHTLRGRLRLDPAEHSASGQHPEHPSVPPAPSAPDTAPPDPARPAPVYLPELDPIAGRLRTARRVVIIACGTASYAGMVAKYAIEQWARIPTEVELSHEFRYRSPVLDPDTLVVSVSQSGETMDTLMAVKYAWTQGTATIAVSNTQGASIPRASDVALYTHAGPEVAVASTKAFVAQITTLYLLGLHLAALRGTMTPDALAAEARHLAAIPGQLREVLAESSRVAQLAHWMADTRAVLFLGRHVGYPIALEGALKLKELAYIHAEGFAAGELKHGPIALIEPGQPVFVIVPSPRAAGSLHPKVVSNIQEVRARGARVIAIAEEGDAAVLPYADEVLRIPLAPPLFEPLLAVVPLQTFALDLAEAKGLDVDQPRNLAKSVTVE